MDIFCPACALGGSTRRPFRNAKRILKQSAKRIPVKTVSRVLPPYVELAPLQARTREMAYEVITHTILQRANADPTSLKPFELLSTDLKELPELDEGSYYGGIRWTLHIYCVKSGAPWVFHIKAKYEAKDAFSRFLLENSVHLLRYPCTVIHDGCGSFGEAFRVALQQRNALARPAPAWCAELNPVEARCILPLCRQARIILLDAVNLTKREYPNALAMAAQTDFVLSSRGGKSPFEVLTGEKPNLAKIQPFGAKAYVHAPKDSGRRGGVLSSHHRSEPAYLLQYVTYGQYDNFQFLTERGTRITSVHVDWDPDHCGLKSSLPPAAVEQQARQMEFPFDEAPQLYDVAADLKDLLDKAKKEAEKPVLKAEVMEDQDEVVVEENRARRLAEQGFACPFECEYGCGFDAKTAEEVNAHQKKCDLAPLDMIHKRIEENQNEWFVQIDELEETLNSPKSSPSEDSDVPDDVASVNNDVADLTDENAGELDDLEPKAPETAAPESIASRLRSQIKAMDLSPLEIKAELKKVPNHEDIKWCHLQGFWKKIGQAAYNKELKALLDSVLTPVEEGSKEWNDNFFSADHGRFHASFKGRYDELLVNPVIKVRGVKNVEKYYTYYDGAGYNYMAHVSELSTIRAVIFRPDRYKRALVSIDIATAFLQSDKFDEDEIRFIKFKNPFTSEWMLFKQTGPLYGEKSAPRRWQETLHAFLDELGFIPVENSPSDWVRYGQTSSDDIILMIWVDDILGDGPYETVHEFIILLKKRFQCKDERWLTPGHTLDHVGIIISLNADNTLISMSMGYYIDKMVDAAGLQNASSLVSPDSSLRGITDFTPLEDHLKPVFATTKGMVGWLSVTIRPDIAYYYSRAGQHSANPVVGAFDLIMNTIRYLKGTRDLGLQAATKRESSDFQFFADSDHAGNSEPQNCRRSQMCLIITEGGAPIEWKSTATGSSKINGNFGDVNPPALSSGEAETMAASEANKRILHLSYVVDELRLTDWPRPVPLHCDASVALAFMANTGNRSRMRHIDVRQEWVKSLRDSDQIVGVKIGTDFNLADIGTKLLLTGTFTSFRDQLLKSVVLPSLMIKVITILARVSAKHFRDVFP